MPTLEILSAEDLRARRAALVVDAGLPEEELRERAADYTLSAEQMGLWSKIEDIDYLLAS